MNKLFFKHDIGARHDFKLQNLMMRFGAEGLGIYWCLIEMLYENGGYLPAEQYKSIAFILHVKEDVVLNVLQSELFSFSKEKEMYYSERVLKEIESMQDLSQKRKDSVMKRWKKNTSNTNVLQNDTDKDKDKDKDNKATDISVAKEEVSSLDEKSKASIPITRMREYRIEQIKLCADALGYFFQLIEKKAGKCTANTAKGARCDKNAAVIIAGREYCLQHAQQYFGLMYDIKFVYSFIEKDFEKVLWTWLNYKHDRKEDYACKASVQAFYSKLIRLSENNPEKAKLIIEQSMANNWAGIFALKDENNNENFSKPNYGGSARIRFKEELENPIPNREL